jgi:hypothetical protein
VKSRNSPVTEMARPQAPNTHADDAKVIDGRAAVRVDGVAAVGDRRVGEGEARGGEEEQRQAGPDRLHQQSRVFAGALG